MFCVSPQGIHISLVICVRGYTYHGDTHITVTPGSKNKEWHGFISEEGENMYKNYELKKTFYHFTKKYSTVAVLFFEGYRSFSLSRNKKNNKSKTNQ